MRVAVIGCGPIGTWHATAVATCGDTRLVAVCDPNPERSNQLANQFKCAAESDYREVLQRHDVDVVTIATPNHQHFQPAMAAIDAGCHVFCEKPLAMDLAEAEQLVAAAEKRQIHLTVDYNRRFGFGYKSAKQWLLDGRLGTVRRCTLQVADHYPRPHVRREPALLLKGVLTHHFDLLHWFCGPATHVFAELQRDRDHELIHDASLVFRHQNGAMGMVSGGYRESQTRTSERCTIEGTMGQMAIDDVTRQVTLVGPDPDQRCVAQPDPFAAGDPFHVSLVDHLQDFLQRLQQGERPAVTGQDALRVLQWTESALLSAQNGSLVLLPSEL